MVAIIRFRIRYSVSIGFALMYIRLGFGPVIDGLGMRCIATGSFIFGLLRKNSDSSIVEIKKSDRNYTNIDWAHMQTHMCIL